MSVSIITGASAGIGNSIARHILDSSSSTKVLLTARSEAPLKQISEKYGEERVSYLIGDIADENLSSALVSKAIEKFGAINSIIANAGVLEPVESVQNVTIKQWKKLFDVNYFSVVDLVSKAIPHLKKTNGNVILVSSGASTKSTYGWAAYGASKAAINHFAICVAAEVPEIKTVAVAPGVVDTKMQNDIRDIHGKSMTSEALQRFLDLKKNNQLLDPDYVAKIYGNLALNGISKELNGQYVRYNDDKLKSYREDWPR